MFQDFEPGGAAALPNSAVSLELVSNAPVAELEVISELPDRVREQS